MSVIMENQESGYSVRSLGGGAPARFMIAAMAVLAFIQMLLVALTGTLRPHRLSGCCCRRNWEKLIDS